MVYVSYWIIQQYLDRIGVNTAGNNDNDVATLYSYTQEMKNRGIVIRVMAHPLLLRWDGMRWEPRRAMNNQPMNTLEVRILTLYGGECQLRGSIIDT